MRNDGRFSHDYYLLSELAALRAGVEPDARVRDQRARDVSVVIAVADVPGKISTKGMVR
jgi:hypothetical protein